MITVIDLGIGNLRSVVHAFARVGAEVSVAHTAADSEGADVLILPGVGAFARAIGRLRDLGFEQLIRRHTIEHQRPLVGICLGMQLLADRSYENGLLRGLGLISGEVRRLEPQLPEHRVPNIGWRKVQAAKRSQLFPAELNGETFYHVHSYHLVCNDQSDVAATIEFGNETLVAAVERDNVYGVQFHPEKSQDAGLMLLESLLRHIRAPGRASH